MTPEEKLEKVEELLAARDEITAELLELMGATDEEEVEEEEERPAPRKKASAVAAGKKQGGCTECGSPSRHKSSCSKASANKLSNASASKETSSRSIHDAPLKLTEDEYNEAMESLGDGLGASAVAFSYPHVELRELMAASKSESYEDYLSK